MNYYLVEVEDSAGIYRKFMILAPHETAAKNHVAIDYPGESKVREFARPNAFSSFPQAYQIWELT